MSSKVFRGEFIYPTAGLLINLNKTLQGLEADNVIVLTRDATGKILTAELSDKERKSGRENYDFYCFLIWPFIESTWLAAVCLMSLTPPSPAEQDVWIDFKQMQDQVQLVGTRTTLDCTLLTANRLARLCITKATFPTMKLSTRNLSRMLISFLKRRA